MTMLGITWVLLEMEQKHKLFLSPCQIYPVCFLKTTVSFQQLNFPAGSCKCLSLYVSQGFSCAVLGLFSLSSPKAIAMTVVAMHMTCFNSICNHCLVRLALIMACACRNRVGAYKSKWQLDTHLLCMSLGCVSKHN